MDRRVFLAGLGTTLIALPAAGAEAVFVIVSRNTSLERVSTADLRRLFLMQSDHLGGKRAVPFNLPRSDLARQRFDREVLNMTPEESARYWVDQRIRGRAKPPRSIHSVELLRKVVAKLPGAVGYLGESDFAPWLRALALDGYPPTNPKYPLR